MLGVATLELSTVTVMAHMGTAAVGDTQSICTFSLLYVYLQDPGQRRSPAPSKVTQVARGQGKSLACPPCAALSVCSPGPRLLPRSWRSQWSCRNPASSPASAPQTLEPCHGQSRSPQGLSLSECVSMWSSRTGCVGVSSYGKNVALLTFFTT